MASPRPPTTSTSVPPQAPRVDTQTTVLDGTHGRILCLADIRGRISSLNDLAREHGASAIIHTGDFGFFENNSLERINDRTLKHLTTYSPLIPGPQRAHLTKNDTAPAVLRQTVSIDLISEFPLLLSGHIKLSVPVYTTWGACEDVAVLEKIRLGTYSVDNLHVIDEAVTRCVDVGGVNLRLLALGGALVPHKMFDNGDGNATIAGGQGTMWATALQIGQLVDTAQRVYDPAETRLLVSHASPGREGLIAQLALVTKADLTISAGLHFRYATSYNEFSVQPDFESFRKKLLEGKQQFDKVWDSVKTQVDAVIDENQRVLLDKALSVTDRIPHAVSTGAADESSWKNTWNWNLTDAAYGVLVLDVKEGRISAELKSQGFNFAYRKAAAPEPTAPTTSKPNTPAPVLSPPKGAPAPPPPHESVAEASASGNTVPAVASPTTSASAEKKKKDKKKDKKDDGSAALSPAMSSPSLAPPKDPLVPDVAGSEDVKSPTTESSGLRTPIRNKPARNPWTIFMRFSITQPTEDEIREYYGDAKAGITKVSLPPSKFGRNSKIAYVEFGDEEAMKAALDQKRERIGDQSVEIKQATEKETRDGPAHRGRGSGGRGRGGGFAARGLAAAGLTRKDD